MLGLLSAQAVWQDTEGSHSPTVKEEAEPFLFQSSPEVPAAPVHHAD